MIIAVYVMRLIRKEIALPASWQEVLLWVRQSFLFFAPALAAVGVWLSQIAPYIHNTTYTSPAARGATVGEMPLFFDRILARMGVADGIDYYILYLKRAFVIYIQDGYGLTGIIMIYTTLYAATRGRKFMDKNNHNIRQATTIYVILLIPCLIYNLFFLQHVAAHIYSSLKFSLALSLAFVLFPVFILQMVSKDHLLPIGQIVNTARTISLAAAIAFSSSVLYAYTQIFDREPVTKMFARPDYTYPAMGNFVKKKYRL